MNQLLENYKIQVDCPDVSGAEHLETLQIRDRLAELEANFSREDRDVLFSADRKLMINIAKIYRELSRFVDLGSYREQWKISPQKWWWYLDVLSNLPTTLIQTGKEPIELEDSKSA
jgi:hypothetical protein